MRWFYHLVRAEQIGWGSDGRYRPASLAKDGFIHASFRDEVKSSARLYFPSSPGTNLKVLAIDPRRLDVRVDVAATPRGPMPHIEGAIPVDAVTKILDLDDFDDEQPDRVTCTRVGLMAFEGMTLLDLVGPLDVLSRISSMGFDPALTCEVFALTRPQSDQTVSDVATWTGSGASLHAARYRPALDGYDVLVVPGGPSTQSLITSDPSILPYLTSYPHNRLIASVCTGAILLAAAGRLEGKRATTHASALDSLAAFSGVKIERGARIVDEANIITSGGVTAGIDMALHLVRRLEGDAVAKAIADRIEWRA